MENRKSRRASGRTTTVEVPSLVIALKDDVSISAEMIRHLDAIKGTSSEHGLDGLSYKFGGDEFITEIRVDFYAASKSLLVLIGDHPYRLTFADEPTQAKLMKMLEVIDSRNRKL